MQRQHAAAGFDRHRIVARQAVIEGILGDAANAVAAHLRFAAVGVEHAHAHIGALGWANQDEAIAADAEVAIADLDAQLGRMTRRRIAHAIDVDVIVADALVLPESHDGLFLSERPRGEGPHVHLIFTQAVHVVPSIRPQSRNCGEPLIPLLHCNSISTSPTAPAMLWHPASIGHWDRPSPMTPTVPWRRVCRVVPVPRRPAVVAVVRDR